MLKLPDTEELRRLFNYDTETGFVTRKVSAGSFLPGYKINSISTHGYLRVCIDYQHYTLHRLIYKMVTGIDPGISDVDHINGDRVDNRIINLRLVNRKGNMQNAKRSKLNTSGHTGVVFDKANRKWEAQIVVDYKNKKLGRFVLKKDAIAARVAGERFYGFHANHGRQQ